MDYTHSTIAMLVGDPAEHKRVKLTRTILITGADSAWNPGSTRRTIRTQIPNSRQYVTYTRYADGGWDHGVDDTTAGAMGEVWWFSTVESGPCVVCADLTAWTRFPLDTDGMATDKPFRTHPSCVPYDVEKTESRRVIPEGHVVTISRHPGYDELWVALCECGDAIITGSDHMNAAADYADRHQAYWSTRITA